MRSQEAKLLFRPIIIARVFATRGGWTVLEWKAAQAQKHWTAASTYYPLIWDCVMWLFWSKYWILKFKTLILEQCSSDIEWVSIIVTAQLNLKICALVSYQLKHSSSDSQRGISQTHYIRIILVKGRFGLDVVNKNLSKNHPSWNVAIVVKYLEGEQLAPSQLFAHV